MGRDKNFFKYNNFSWDGIKQIEYKSAEKTSETFHSVTRQNIFESTVNTMFDMRYFECAVNGFTTLEKHEHEHVVMVMRGKGKVIIRDEVLAVEPHDLFVIPSWAPHQLVNDGHEPFGFICTVNGKRDEPVLLAKSEIEVLKMNVEIKKTMCVPESYFDFWDM